MNGLRKSRRIIELSETGRVKTGARSNPSEGKETMRLRFEIGLRKLSTCF